MRILNNFAGRVLSSFAGKGISNFTGRAQSAYVYNSQFPYTFPFILADLEARTLNEETTRTLKEAA